MSLLHPKSLPWGSLADPGCGTPSFWGDVAAGSALPTQPCPRGWHWGCLCVASPLWISAQTYYPSVVGGQAFESCSVPVQLAETS